ncbi:hypothetical protein ACFXOI_19030 [Streptomyces bacillaris]|uniref:hypothetical protein n=1 Tax=Streptomyces bacillaris TaxID=68179 RepID=UPI00369713AB
MAVITWFFSCLLSLIAFIALGSLSQGFDIDALGVAAVCLAVTALIIRVGRSRIILTDLNVVVVNPVFTYMVPCAVVRNVEEEHALTLVTNSNERIHSSAFGSSLIDFLFRSTERAAMEVEAHVRRVSRKGTGNPVVVRRLARSWLADLYCLAALACAVAAIWGGNS